ncbi:Structure-specific recognition [Chlorella sorokiniana]|uniref:FACT complex subunit SSRP1 n=1 Tax=Chlorella sorokiniana TaxID=3076 RepID=A0A2P6TIK9_CHLSO|nr:Structure-specific recognition [Chlorella sorokiniana]|eukprot:PRW39086.1 Structure-specific recognition [Chlorella sorokiniana]
MSENGGSMQALRKEVAGCPSGARLAAALESASLANSDIPSLITAVIGEKLAASGSAGAAAAKPAAAGGTVGSGAPAAATPAAAAAAAPAERQSLDSALCVVDGLSFLHPRGKQQLALFPDRLLVRTTKADIAVPYAAIQHVAIIDCIPGDTKGKVLLYLHIDSNHTKVMNGKTQLSAVVIQTTADAQLDVAHPQGGARLQGAAPVVLCQALGAVPYGVDPTSFVSPDAAYFQSADRAAGVRAHVKAKDGFLYPLPTAICFLDSPAVFIPHSAIRSVEMMRAGGASSTFDVVLHLKSGKQQEFTFIARQEAPALEDYLRKCRLPLGAAASSDEEGEEEEAEAAEAAEAEDEDSDDLEDEDFNPSSSSDEEEEEAGGSQQQRSGGSKRGRAAADEGDADGEGEEDEHEDEEEAEESSSEEEDSSDEEGSVELVSEEDFTLDQLESALSKEATERRAKRRRTLASGRTMLDPASLPASAHRH